MDVTMAVEYLNLQKNNSLVQPILIIVMFIAEP